MAETIGILLFDDVEELDFAGPWEVDPNCADPWMIIDVLDTDQPSIRLGTAEVTPPTLRSTVT